MKHHFFRTGNQSRIHLVRFGSSDDGIILEKDPDGQWGLFWLEDYQTPNRPITFGIQARRIAIRLAKGILIANAMTEDDKQKPRPQLPDEPKPAA